MQESLNREAEMESWELGGRGFSQVVLAAGFACAAIVLSAPWAVRFGLVDRPRGRRQHKHAVPLTGGFAIFAAFALVYLASAPRIEPSLLYSLLLPAGVLLVAGILDDLFELSAVVKLVFQIAAVLVAVLLGDLRIESLGNLFGGGEIVLGAWAVPFTVFAVVGVINAVNMIDGMDGLAAMIVIAALGWLAVSAFSMGATGQITLMLILAGAVAGFLVFNFRLPWRQQAEVFMGDSGSAVLGFLLAWFAIHLSQGAGSALYPISAVWILGLPVMDALALILRRPLHGRSPMAGARDHVHHVLFGSGLCYRATISTLVLSSAMCGAVGVYGALFSVPEHFLFAILVAVFGGHLVYTELRSRGWVGRRRELVSGGRPERADTAAAKGARPLMDV
jgi:UDP-GlcNAc:undecaprenyl-phosphate GlcNAc-1-phosphate transferase